MARAVISTKPMQQRTARVSEIDKIKLINKVQNALINKIFTTWVKCLKDNWTCKIKKKKRSGEQVKMALRIRQTSRYVK